MMTSINAQYLFQQQTTGSRLQPSASVVPARQPTASSATAPGRRRPANLPVISNSHQNPASHPRQQRYAISCLFQDNIFQRLHNCPFRNKNSRRPQNKTTLFRKTIFDDHIAVNLIFRCIFSSKNKAGNISFYSSLPSVFYCLPSFKVFASQYTTHNRDSSN